MSTIPENPEPVTLAEASAALMRGFGGTWTIKFDASLHAWTAEHREGTAVRYLVARRASELAAKINAAEAETEETP